jgi:hypothetical protein
MSQKSEVKSQKSEERGQDIPHPSSLISLQRWMQAVITHPDGVAAGAESQQARQYLDVSSGKLDTVIGRSRNLTSEERLAIYHNAYFSRLLECLRNIYPMLAKTLGDEAFDALAIGYLQAHPSESYTLDRLGDNLHGYLAKTRPDLDDAEEPTEDWPDFLIDLARLEWNIGEVFDGPGVEGLATIEADQLLAIEADRWPAVRLSPAPCVRALAFRFPINDYFTSMRQTADDAAPPPLPQPEPTWLALSRRDFVVRRHALDQRQYELLTVLMSGQPIGVAIERLATCVPLDLDHLADDLHGWFRTWLAAGFFIGLSEV